MRIDTRKLGQAIGKIRRSRKLTQKTVAEKIGVTVTHISNIESGRNGVSLETLNEIANVLDVPTTFLTLIGTQTPPDKALAKLLRSYCETIYALVETEPED